MNYTYTVHYEICDNVLKNIRDKDDMHEVDIESFLKEDRRAKLAIVRTLDNDGYAHRVSPQTDPFRISITVKGVQFLIDGGYNTYFSEMRENANLERQLLSTNISTNRAVKFTSNSQLVISIFVALFVIVSSIYQVLTYRLERAKAEREISKPGAGR